MSYAFTLDASACSGCKACQEACKDKNRLPVGVLWRRVIEVTGGEWRANGNAWENNIFGYNLSVACNHCTHPKCAGVCPVDAYHVRPDGIVLLDVSKCMGCGYCAWACPYGAPQYDNQRGIMTKCDFCVGNLDIGMPPTCVSACPLRVLNIITIEETSLFEESQYLWQLPASVHPFPLPEFSRTEPHLAITPHPAMHNVLEKAVSNREEIIPPRAFEYPKKMAGRHEFPLMVFTLLAQMSAGLAICGLITPLPRPAMLSIGILLGLGGLVSLFHLGQKHNAWRAVIHIRKSWLSREVSMAGLLAIAWAVSVGWQFWRGAPASPWPVAILGMGLVFCMSRVYCLRAVPPWNTWRTPATFFMSAAILGALGVSLFIIQAGWMMIAGAAMAVNLAITFITPSPAQKNATRLRTAILGLSLLGVVSVIAIPAFHSVWMAWLIFSLAMAGEVLGRWQFYTERVPFPFRPK
jgi:anaerobic dimethyl sulfoxide reductase subunit B (iron-sulfur subunit)